jgi:Flp pilus assembly pilin Flp
MERMLTLPRDETADTAIDYALLLVGFALVVVASVIVFGSSIQGLFDRAMAVFQN